MIPYHSIHGYLNNMHLQTTAAVSPSQHQHHQIIITSIIKYHVSSIIIESSPSPNQAPSLQGRWLASCLSKRMDIPLVVFPIAHYKPYNYKSHEITSHIQSPQWPWGGRPGTAGPKNRLPFAIKTSNDLRIWVNKPLTSVNTILAPRIHFKEKWHVSGYFKEIVRMQLYLLKSGSPKNPRDVTFRLPRWQWKNFEPNVMAGFGIEGFWVGRFLHKDQNQREELPKWICLNCRFNDGHKTPG